jgi:hypothetical protein
LPSSARETVRASYASGLLSRLVFLGKKPSRELGLMDVKPPAHDRHGPGFFEAVFVAIPQNPDDLGFGEFARVLLDKFVRRNDFIERDLGLVCHFCTFIFNKYNAP